MAGIRRIVIPARRGCALAVRAGEVLRVINTHGTQCVDTWAVVSAQEYLSMAHCREINETIYFGPGQSLVSNRYRPLLLIRADSWPGRHDSLIAACNREFYLRAGRAPDHPNCADNLAAALRSVGLALPFTPQPWNLFMLASVAEDGRISYRRPPLAPGAAVELEVLSDCCLAFSACPDDIYPTNGGDGAARDAHVELYDKLVGEPAVCLDGRA
jgi:hypothetical protein